jgi:hypothetical protein
VFKVLGLDAVGRRRPMSDGVIHGAIIHHFSRFKENSETDRCAIEILGSPLGRF